METSLSVIDMLKEGEDAARQQARDPTRALLDEHRLIAVLCQHDSPSLLSVSRRETPMGLGVDTFPSTLL